MAYSLGSDSEEHCEAEQREREMSELKIHGTMSVPVTDELIAALDYVNARELLPRSVAVELLALVITARSIRAGYARQVAA
jgi:hypothetical protein